MEKNKAFVDLDEYNELKQFKENIEKGNAVFLYGGYYNNSKFITTDEVLKNICGDLMKEIKELHIKQNELYDSINNLERKNKLYNNTIISICKMTYWQFRKWRKEYTNRN